jgi:LysM repeat protein
VRLTRRGRVVVVLFLAGVLVVTGWAVGRSVANAATTHQPPAASVVAKPGDTLWSIAVRVRPNTDPRITVDQIMAANRLASPVLQPGQRVVLPRF